MQLLTAVMVLKREKLLAVSLSDLRIKVFWTMFSHVQGQMLTNPHLKLPFPVSLSSFLPAQRLVYAISSVPWRCPQQSKSPQNWLGPGQTAVGKVKINTASNFGYSRWLFEHFPCVCLCQPGRCSAFPWRVVQSSKYMGKTPGFWVAVDACLQARGQLFLASSEFLWRLYLLDWREENLRVERLGYLGAWLPRSFAVCCQQESQFWITGGSVGMLEQPGCQCMECVVGNVLFAVSSVWRGLGLRAAPPVPQAAS